MDILNSVSWLFLPPYPRADWSSIPEKNDEVTMSCLGMRQCSGPGLSRWATEQECSPQPPRCPSLLGLGSFREPATGDTFAWPPDFRTDNSFCTFCVLSRTFLVKKITF